MLTGGSVLNWSHKLGNLSNVEGELAKAFNAWSLYSGLKFGKVGSGREADIKLSFGRYVHGDRFPFDGPGYVLAHAYFPYEYGDLGGDVHFDDDEEWDSNSLTSTPVDFFTVAVHEIGHALGLSHSPVRDSIMFPYYMGKEDSRTFSIGYDDILAMYELYSELLRILLFILMAIHLNL